MKNKKSQKGFSLFELLIYIVIAGVAAGLMVGILLNILKVQTRESSSVEVSNQLNFVTQTIQRLVRESSLIDMATGTATSFLKLRMADPAKDPTYISLENNAVKIKEGANATTTLTNDRISVDSLSFNKFSQYPGHDTVQIDIAITSATNSQVGQDLRSGIARVSASTFDDSILPGADNTYNIGLINTRWKDLNLSGLLNLGVFASDPSGQNGSIYYNSTNNVFRGYSSSTWLNLGSLWNASGADIYYNTGNVGIGTTTPNNLLQVSGLINFPNDKFGTFLGYQAGNVNLGDKNTFVGYQSGSLNTDGYYNSAMGYKALYSNTTGNYNSAIGYLALTSNTTGNSNSATGGYLTLYSNTTGSNNSAMGLSALYSNTTGYGNTALGSFALFSNTTGYNNAVLGYSAGRFLADGITANAITNNSVYIGYNTRASASGVENENVFGYNAIGQGGNSVVLGNDSILKTALKGNVGINTTNPQGALDVVSTTGAFIVPRMTTTQRNALTAINGMIIYNITTSQFNFREDGAWVLK